MDLTTLEVRFNRSKYLVKTIRRMLRSATRKRLPDILRDFRDYWVATGGFPSQYTYHGLYDRSVRDITRFASLADHRILARARDAFPADVITRNKLATHLHFRSAGIRMPELLGHNFRHVFVLGGEALDIRNLGPGEVYQRLTAAGTAACFVKPMAGQGGFGIHRLTPETSEGEVARILHRVSAGAYLFERTVQQHSSISRVFPGALNILRILSAWLPDGTCRILSAIIRFGVGTSFVDNTSQGGLKASIDLSTGYVNSPAIRVKAEDEWEAFLHPDSKVPFAEIQIPHIAETLALVDQAHRHLPCPLLGWDVGISPDGPVLIEVNGRADVVGSEIAIGGFREHPVFREIIEAFSNVPPAS